MIRVRDLVVRVGAVTALRLEALDVDQGARRGVVGPNGSGKTTLLRVLAGFQRPTAGRVEGVPPPGRTVLVHQRPYFFRGTARANVAYALAVRGGPPAEADAWLARFGMAHLAGREARRLSGGEGRRVAIARALAARPEVLLLDEPFTALDPEGREVVEAVLSAFEGTVLLTAPSVAGVPAQVAVTHLAGA